MQNRPLIPVLVLTLSLPAAAFAAIAADTAPPSSGTEKAPAKSTAPAVTAPAPTAPAKTPAIRFSEMDANRDSRITRAEWQGNEVSFAQHDTNADGVLAGSEVTVPAATAGAPAGDQPGVHDRGRLTRLFRNLDGNRDGRLNPNELKAKKKFERLDTNRDKLVSRDEFFKQ